MSLASGTFVKRRGRTLSARLWSIRSGKAGLCAVVFIILSVVVGPAMSRYDPDTVDLLHRLEPPSFHHWLGTDQLGRDQLTRILAGGRQSLGAALLIMSGIILIALCWGICAGITGGIVDVILMRFVDIILATPSLIITLAVIGALGVGFDRMILAIIVSSWPYYARLTRSYVVTCMARDDVVADLLAGISRTRVVIGHILPGVFTQLLVIATLNLGSIIIQIAGLSFLGLGLQPPLAEWGAMLSDSRLYFMTMPWLVVTPSLAIFVSVAAFNLVGNALHRAA